MAEISLPKSLNDVDAGGTFKVPAPGEYTLEVKQAKVGKSQAGNTKIDVGLQIVDDDEFAGSYVWECLTLTDAALFKVKQFLLAIGMDADVSSIDTDEWIGEQCDVTLDIETFTNKSGEEVEKAVIKKYKFDAE